MAYTNSPLAVYTRISPNRNSPRNMPITKITVHHIAGVCSLEQFGNIVANPARQMSANYAIGNDGRIGLFCPESDRSWCSSSPSNDHQAITIEVSNCEYGDVDTDGDGYAWSIGPAAYNSLIELCVDICKRNGIKKLEFTGDKNGSLTYHYMFAATSCLPVDRTELLTPFGWKLLKDIHIGDVVATAHIDNMGIKFDEVENIVPLKIQDTYITRDFEATSDHRVIYYNQAGRQYVGQFKDLYDLKGSTYLPNAGFIENSEGFGGLGSADIEFLVAVQADGHYMADGDCHYGIEFHLKKERKIKRLKKLFEVLGFKYTVCEQTDGTKKLRLYGADFVHKCEEYLNNKCFTWDWLNMNRKQVEYFMDAILQYDGCEANKSYSSTIPENVDIVQAIAAINGIGTKMTKEHDRVYFKKYMRTLGDNERQRKPKQQVSCVTVRSGFILIRQHGRTTITGNCPGPWMKAHTQDLCDKVNSRLGASTSTPLGLYTVKLYTGTPIYDTPDGAIVGEISASTKYTIVEEKSIDGYKYGKLKSGAGWVILEKPEEKPSTPVGKEVSYTVHLDASDTLYDGPNGSKKGTVGTTGVFTMVEELVVDGTKYGKLKSGIGWVVVKEKPAPAPAPAQTAGFKVGDLVKINMGAVYYNGASIPDWVKQDRWYISYISGNRAVLGENEARNRNIQSPINTIFLNKVSGGSTSSSSQIKVGDWVKVTNNVIYGTNTKFVMFVPKYKVLELNGDRAVISSDGRNVTTAISVKNIQKI